MLAQDVIQRYGDRVRFVSENWGTSKLADRFGLKRYPVVFVNDVLLARSEDFGWFGAKGRYTPWLKLENHEKFKKDLTHMIDLELKGDTRAAREAQSPASPEEELARLPQLNAKDLAGSTVDAASLSGKIVVVEFWATWCLPCRSTLPWLGELKRRHGDRIEILAIAVDSEESEVRKLTQPMDLPFHVVMGSAGLAESFGDLSSVPTMFIFKPNGTTASILYGAPQDLHDRVGHAIDALLQE